MAAWLVFAAAAVVVVIAGSRLAVNGDALAQRMSLSRAMLGAVLVSAATSLPELVTDGSAALQGNASLAIGDLFGSSMANVGILAVAMLIVPGSRMLTRVAVNQALVANLGIALTALATVAILFGGGPSLWGIGWAPLAVFAGYIGGVSFLQRNRTSPLFMTRQEVAESTSGVPSLRRAAIAFVLAALGILVAAPFLAASSADIADQLGLSAGFVGVSLLGITTSLPELSVTFASVRAGAYDLAVGNLLGSNSFNMALLLPLELLNGDATLLANSSADVAIAGVTAIMMMGLVTMEILNRSERRFQFSEPVAVVLLGCFVLGLSLAYFATE